MTDPLAAYAALDGVPSAYASARDGIDALLRDRGLRRTPPGLSAESLLRGAQASAVLAGSGSSLPQVREGHGDDVARRAVRLSTQLLAVAPTLGTAPMQALARLHSVAAGGAVANDRLGRPRDAEAAQRLHRIAGLLLARTRAPALLVAAVAHAELAAARAFGSDDGLVARAVERALLVARGVDPTSVIVPEAGHLLRREEYRAALEGYRTDGTVGAHRWLLYAADAFTRATEASPLYDEGRPG